jgi:NAD+ kinase
LKNILVFTHHEKLENNSIFEDIFMKIDSNKVRFYCLETDALSIRYPELSIKEDNLSENNIDLIMTLGGDGTILRTVDYANSLGVPVLGVNLGKLGFLAEVEPDEAIGVIDLFIKGKAIIDARMLLECEIPSDTGKKYRVALNDCVISKSVAEKLLRFSIIVNDEQLVSFAADAIIFSTPTGSTAYSLSAGGPIVSPVLEAVIVTPVCPHTIFSRSMVFSKQDEIRIQLDSPSKEAIISIDGKAISSFRGEHHVVVRCSDRRFKIIANRKKTFYVIFKEKFLNFS